MDELLTIGQVAEQTGLATSALRYYDERGLVEPARRVSGQRRYHRDVLRRLRIIGLCQRAGFTLAEIEQLLDGTGDWRPLAEDKLAELDRRVRELRDARRLVRAALDCDCADLEGCENTAHDVPQQICGTRPASKTKETA